jgi:uncharacterized iron-regulated protein
MKKTFLWLSFLILLSAMQTDKEAYRVFNGEGVQTSYSNLLEAALEADVVLFGELHNNPVCHWLQYELMKDMQAAGRNNLIAGAEMFESDNQLLLDEYLSGTIRNKNFEEEARLWKNYKTDYKPLVEFAKENGIPFIATNIPRRYAALVNKEGFEGLEILSEEAKNLIAPLPVKYDPELPGYKKMTEMMGGMPGNHDNSNFPKAQAIKDATMSHFILKNREQGSIFIHFNGAYHSDNYEGIAWYLKKSAPDLRILTISSVEQEDVSELSEEHLGVAGFILCIPSSMTKTY